MELKFGPRGTIEMSNATIIWKNFSGRPDKYNRAGDRNFAVVIPTEEIKDKLVDDVNRFDVGWNVKIRPPREEGDEPFMYLPVKVNYYEDERTGKVNGPDVYLKSGNAVNKLSEDMIGMLDDIEIENVDLDIRPYDGEVNGKPFRSAKLKAIWVTQRVDRFAERYAAANEEDF